MIIPEKTQKVNSPKENLRNFGILAYLITCACSRLLNFYRFLCCMRQFGEVLPGGTILTERAIDCITEHTPYKSRPYIRSILYEYGQFVLDQHGKPYYKKLNITSDKSFAHHFGAEGSQRGIDIPAELFYGKLSTCKAAILAALGAQGEHSAPVSRASRQRKFGISKWTQRRYEKDMEAHGYQVKQATYVTATDRSKIGRFCTSSTESYEAQDGTPVTEVWYTATGANIYRSPFKVTRTQRDRRLAKATRGIAESQPKKYPVAKRANCQKVHDVILEQSRHSDYQTYLRLPVKHNGRITYMFVPYGANIEQLRYRLSWLDNPCDPSVPDRKCAGQSTPCALQGDNLG